MRRLLALIALFPAVAAAQDFTSTTEAFDRFASETATMPEDARVKLFRDRFNALVPGFYEPRNGASEADYDARIAKGFADYPAIREAFLAAGTSFGSAFATAGARFRTFFPDYRQNMPVYLVHSFGEMDGGTRELRGSTVAIFGADVIARIHDSASIGPFLDHELFHLYHSTYFADCEQVWCSLWVEGLAVYVAHRLNPDADDRALLLTIPRPIRPAVDLRFGEAVCVARAKFDSSADPDLRDFFTTRGGGGSTFPPRFGYYLGYRIAEEVGKTRDLQQLAKMPPAEVRKAMLGALGKMANCPR